MLDSQSSGSVSFEWLSHARNDYYVEKDMPSRQSLLHGSKNDAGDVAHDKD